MKPCSVLLVAVSLLLSQRGLSQKQSLVYLGDVKNDHAFVESYDSLDGPFLIVDSSVYAFAPECIGDGFGGTAKSSKGKDPKVRNSGGGVAERTDRPRNSGGGVAEKPVPARNSGGGVAESERPARNSGGGVAVAKSPVRKSGGGVAEKTAFTCKSKGDQVILYLSGIHSANVRLYYQHQFVDKKFFKIENE